MTFVSQWLDHGMFRPARLCPPFDGVIDQISPNYFSINVCYAITSNRLVRFDMDVLHRVQFDDVFGSNDFYRKV